MHARAAIALLLAVVSVAMLPHVSGDATQSLLQSVEAEAVGFTTTLQLYLKWQRIPNVMPTSCPNYTLRLRQYRPDDTVPLLRSVCPEVWDTMDITIVIANVTSMFNMPSPESTIMLGELLSQQYSTVAFNAYLATIDAIRALFALSIVQEAFPQCFGVTAAWLTPSPDSASFTPSPAVASHIGFALHMNISKSRFNFSVDLFLTELGRVIGIVSRSEVVVLSLILGEQMGNISGNDSFVNVTFVPFLNASGVGSSLGTWWSVPPGGRVELRFCFVGPREATLQQQCLQLFDVAGSQWLKDHFFVRIQPFVLSVAPLIAPGDTSPDQKSLSAIPIVILPIIVYAAVMYWRRRQRSIEQKKEIERKMTLLQLLPSDDDDVDGCCEGDVTANECPKVLSVWERERIDDDEVDLFAA